MDLSSDAEWQLMDQCSHVHKAGRALPQASEDAAFARARFFNAGRRGDHRVNLPLQPAPLGRL